MENFFYMLIFFTIAANIITFVIILSQYLFSDLLEYDPEGYALSFILIVANTMLIFFNISNKNHYEIIDQILIVSNIFVDIVIFLQFKIRIKTKRKFSNVLKVYNLLFFTEITTLILAY